MNTCETKIFQIYIYVLFFYLYRDVNGPGLPVWKEYDKKHEFYIMLNHNITLLEKLYEDRMKFWITDVQVIVGSIATHHLCDIVVLLFSVVTGIVFI